MKKSDTTIHKMLNMDDKEKAEYGRFIQEISTVKESPAVYPIFHGDHVIQYDENVFVWKDETGRAAGMGDTLQEAEAQLDTYACYLNASSEKQPAVFYTVPFEPTVEQCNLLVKDVILWIRTHHQNIQTPNRLYSFLNNQGYQIPEWVISNFKDTPEDSPCSKGQIAALIYKIMLFGTNR